ncbi:hypothetical protein [Moorena producens]|uniref:hypothetical protein n=1 Tax=Moorena producens TaxID=1155739 RepID=UPI0011EA68E0|nr:hypothetical protein [Moorena producens]
MQSASGGNHGSRSWRMGLCAEPASAPVSHAKREWGKPRQCGLGGSPQDRTGSPVPLLHRSPAPWEPPRRRCLPCSLAASLIQKLRAES